MLMSGASMKPSKKIFVLACCFMMVDFGLSQSPINIPRSNNPAVPQNPSVPASSSGQPLNSAETPVAAPSGSASAPAISDGVATESASPTVPAFSPVQPVRFAEAPAFAPSAQPAPAFSDGPAAQSATSAQLSTNEVSPAPANDIATSPDAPLAPAPSGDVAMAPDASTSPVASLAAMSPMSSDQASSSPNNTPNSPANPAVNNGELCRAGINIGQVWNENSTSGESFVVYMYLTAGSNQTVEFPWKLTARNPDYADFVQFWNIGNVTTFNNTLSGQVPTGWDTVQPANLNTVDFGFVAHSLTNLTDNAARQPVSVTANDVPCEIYKYG